MHPRSETHATDSVRFKPAPPSPTPRPCSPYGRRAAILLTLAAAGLVGCQDKDPTSSGASAAQATRNAPDGALVSDGAAASGPMTSANNGSLSLPLYQSVASSEPAFHIDQSGTAGSGIFSISNSASSTHALVAETSGRGVGVLGRSAAGEAGRFEILYPNNTKAALVAETNGTGVAISGVGRNLSTAATFENVLSTNARPVVAVTNRGSGYAAVFAATTASGQGVYIQTKGGAGLQVYGGSKNAVVATPSGSKALYTEESTEVWFTDYGYGKLENGRARVLFDPSFAQTINPAEPYHIFVQPYGRSELYVTERSPLGFTVERKDGDPNAEFSYRIVAKRLGFEGKRLESVPWADRMASGFAQAAR